MNEAFDIQAYMTAGVEKSIAKAKLNHEDEIVSVLKDVKHQLIEMGGGEDGQKKNLQLFKTDSCY